MAVWTWYSCDLKTGRVQGRLPLQTSGTVTRVLSGAGAGGVTLPIQDERCPADWESITEPGRTIFVATVTTARRETIVWHGIAWRRERSDDSSIVTFDCGTVESYLARRFVDFGITLPAGTDQHDIAAALVNHANTSGIGLTVDAPPSSVTRDATSYQRYADQRISDQIGDLAEADQGPEWAIDGEFVTDSGERRVAFTIRFRTPHLGGVVTAPEWVFRWISGGQANNIVSWNLSEDFGDGQYANVVVAGGQGDGTDRIMSTSAIAQDLPALQFGWPLIEHRLATQEETQAAVDAAAKGALEALKRGTTTLTLTVRADQLDLNDMWGLGDTCTVRLRGPQVPAGYDGLFRIVDWAFDPQADTLSPTVTPWPG